LTRQELFEQIKQKGSFLCIGLDTDIDKIPKHLLQYPDPVFEFNRSIIDATQDLCIAYKINTAFYESLGVKGWQSLQKTWEYIPKNIFTIADAKRGDIGNTSAMYADAFFNVEKSGLGFDAITVNPYMGEDSVMPFLQFKNKWVILLALTSNKGSQDFQVSQKLEGLGSRFLYELVLEQSQQWGNPDNMMYVIGATHPGMFSHIRSLVPDHFFLVPGVGTQGGDLNQLAKNGMNKQCGLLVNASRSIIYASGDANFAENTRSEAMKLREEMKVLLEKYS